MSVEEVDGTFVRNAPHVKGIRGGFSAKETWRRGIIKVKFQNATGGLKPLFPIERLQELRCHFEDGEGSLIELCEEEFVDIFIEVLKNRRYSRHQLGQWFRDIDVDCSNYVSWDEFTSFMIYQATNSGDGNERAKEFVYDPNPIISLPKEHKDTVKRVVCHSRVPYYITGGYDGLIKFWRPRDTACAHTINNGSHSAARGPQMAGMLTYVSPIVDLALNARGSSLYACSTDKSVNVFEPTSFSLSRRYLGTASSAHDTLLKKEREAHGGGGGSGMIGQKAKGDGKRSEGDSNIETYTLKNMDETPSTLDVATPLGRDVLLFGMTNGEIMTYPGSKQSVNAEVAPLRVTPVHSGAITKLRYIKPLEAIVTSSWDTTLKLTCPETAKTLSTLSGAVDDADMRHSKSTVDFTFCNSMRLLASVGCDRNVLVWNPMMNTPLGCLRGHNAMLQSITFDETDNHLISLDVDNTIRVWDLRMYQPFQTITPGSSDAALASITRYSTLTYDNNRHQLVGAGNRLTTWTVRRALSTFPATHIGHSDNTLSMTYVPPTNSLVSCDTNIIMSWNLSDGRRNILWDTECGTNNVCCVEIDEMQRRLFVGFKDGSLKIFNYRNGQVLRETEAPKEEVTEPLRLVHLTNRDLSSRLVALVTSKQLIFYNEITDAQGFLSKTHDTLVQAPPGATFCSATVCPAAGFSTTSALVVGTTEGAVMVYSATTGLPLLVANHPARARTRQHSRRQGGYKPVSLTAESFLRENQMADSAASPASSPLRSSLKGHNNNVNGDAGGTPSSPSNAPPNGMVRAAVEDIVYLAELDLFATVVGDNSIFFWDLRSNTLKYTFTTSLIPEECLLCLASSSPRGTTACPPLTSEMSASPPPGTRHLISSCDNGFVYVRDISGLPTVRAPSSHFDGNTQIITKHVFRAHNAPITRLLYVPGPNMIVTMSTLDTFIKQFTQAGDFIGYFGQETRWNMRHPSTFGAEQLGAPKDDSCPQPRPMTSGFMRTGTSQLGSRLGKSGSKLGSRHSRSKGTPTHKKLFSAASFIDNAPANSTSGVVDGGDADADAGSSFMTQFVALPVLPVADKSGATNTRLSTPLTAIDGSMGLPPLFSSTTLKKQPSCSEQPPSLHREDSRQSPMEREDGMPVRTFIPMASSKPMKEGWSSETMLVNISGGGGGTVGSAKKMFGTMTSSRYLHLSPNTPHNPFQTPKATSGKTPTHGLLKPILSTAKYRQTGGGGAIGTRTQMKDTLEGKPMTPADVNPESVNGAVKKRLNVKWKKKSLASNSTRASTAFGFDPRSMQKIGGDHDEDPESGGKPPRSSSALGVSNVVVLQRSNTGADGQKHIGDSDAAYLYHLKKFQTSQGGWSEKQNVGLVRENLNPNKGSSISKAMEASPKAGWVGRAASLLETQQMEHFKNPLAPKKKLKEL